MSINSISHSFSLSIILQGPAGTCVLCWLPSLATYIKPLSLSSCDWEKKEKSIKTANMTGCCQTLFVWGVRGWSRVQGRWSERWGAMTQQMTPATISINKTSVHNYHYDKQKNFRCKSFSVNGKRLPF